MGIWESFSDIVEAVTPWSVVEAEAPAEEPKEEPAAEETKEEEAPAAEEPEKEEEKEEEEEEEEEEDEIVDPKVIFEKECEKSAQCSPVKHHFDECVERVHKQESEEGEAKEDCVEEFFHLAHCATACAAPKLWAKLK
ncbi:Complex III subunit 6 [Cladobotryum mycophilum]|uniref:Complex III subunit 6 n=1 Tax=Cladobotryum mycophilum TaxID=491253 RepID=A0ABR0S6U2_9HYPO